MVNFGLTLMISVPRASSLVEVEATSTVYPALLIITFGMVYSSSGKLYWGIIKRTYPVFAVFASEVGGLAASIVPQTAGTQHIKLIQK
jgi:hypothetical protein